MSVWGPCCRINRSALASQNKTFEIYPLPNPWRTKAKGRLPINLYLDYTSGNISKKFNKHIVYYCTLAGLPPKLSNMEYNCHVVCLQYCWSLGPERTSCGSVEVCLDHSAYSSVLRKNVLVISVVLSFQANTSMAEIPNTPILGKALHACRMCNLKACKKGRHKIMFLGSWD
ncbi:hypothetical protein VP01_6220g1 [Puccinia sorghi]|uniref:Uncharacterized protein n=1 Tax=Puccinia sorghi TaxID=27349 RepID=A0A0L6UGL9_9BASI|nr:hypothetical protein VP01_6220g1 [Puccinia sorghi]